MNCGTGFGMAAGRSRPTANGWSARSSSQAVQTADALAKLTQCQRLAARSPMWIAWSGPGPSAPPPGPEELPIGGYSDVATRGQPEKSCPASSPRTAGNSSAFRRQRIAFFSAARTADPDQGELVLLLDQGVRRWGDGGGR